MFKKELMYKKAALYIRVSSEIQVREGDSLGAQEESLRRFANAHHMEVVGVYADEGKTARKELHKRASMKKLLSDLGQKEIEVILFIKMDRWSRNIKDYYKVQDVLDAHHVEWSCTEEDYDTKTTNGRLNLNIRLSVAQNESDQTSDRIKFVQASKVARGEVISGSAPRGYVIKDKHLKIDDDQAKIVKNVFDYFERCRSQKAVRRYVLDKYGINISQASMKKILTNEVYKGCYRGNYQYCPVVIPAEQFDHVQELLKMYSRSGGSQHTYVFGGLVRCTVCGHPEHGQYDRRKDGTCTYYYRCTHHYNRMICPNGKNTQELVIENYLVEHIHSLLKGHMVHFNRQKAANHDCSAKKKKIEMKLEKLKELYINDLISLDTYRADWNKYHNQLNTLNEKTKPNNKQNIRNFLDLDFDAIYNNLSREEKKILWASVIKEIWIDEKGEVKDIIFL